MIHFQQLVQTRSAILLSGETGTGKSNLARKIHAASCPHRPFIDVNLASLQENLLESELFGHKRGAFTGAISDKGGFLDQVKEGILFLDEIGELNLGLQKKLLQLLEDKTYSAVGCTIKKKFRGRLIVATHKPLKKLIELGEFRADLYYRLQVFPYHLMSLKEESSQINSLANSLLAYHFHSPQVKISEEVRAFFLSYSWPGNIRELKNCLEFALNFTQDEILLKHLPQWMQEKPLEQIKGERPLSYYQALEQFEANYFRHSMEFYGGKINESARALEISKVTLLSKLKKYHINALSFKAKLREIELAS